MKNVIVDFESFYDKKNGVSVSTQGIRNYVKDTYAYLVSIVSDDLQFCGSPEEAGKALGDSWMKDPDIQLWAANSNFDEALWGKYFPAAASPWKCILDLAAFHQLPGDLANVSRVLLKQKVDKSLRERMDGQHYKDLPETEQQEVLDYCLNDSIVEQSVLKTLGPMSDLEDKVAAHTRMTCRRGVHIDLDKVERDKTYLERVHHDAFKLIPWTKDGSAPLSYNAFADYCAVVDVKPPVSLDKRNADCIAWIKNNPVHSKVLLAMRTYRGSNTKLEKLKSLQARVCDGVLPMELLYCGARHTRRWSCRGFNLQNLDKERAFGDIMSKWPEFEGKEPEDVGVFMREYLLPPPGCIFGILDFAQVEPRCLNWLAGNNELLDAMRLGYSYYEAYAKAIEGWKGSPGTIKKDLGLDKYTLLKNKCLGLGYGMSARKFADYAKVSELDAKTAVDKWRKANPKILQFWRMFDQKIRVAVKDSDHTLTIEMPTGDKLQHFNIRAKGERQYESFTIKGDFSQMSIQPRLWGGTLTENVTQRMARDVMAESILKLESAGLPVIFHAHDEVVLALPIAGAESALKEAEQIMSKPPEWAEGLPLGVEGFLSPHYTK